LKGGSRTPKIETKRGAGAGHANFAIATSEQQQQQQQPRNRGTTTGAQGQGKSSAFNASLISDLDLSLAQDFTAEDARDRRTARTKKPAKTFGQICTVRGDDAHIDELSLHLNSAASRDNDRNDPARLLQATSFFGADR
jgi:hypothetical protein